MNFDLKEIANSLETETCALHGQHPKAEVKDGDIQIAACCDAFNQELQEKIQVKIAAQLETSLEEMFKNLGPAE